MDELLRAIHAELADDQAGCVATYIPALAEVDPNLWGIAFTDIHGNVAKVGDANTAFCLSSCVAPLTYCVARTLRGDTVHKHVGYEPSGHPFNAVEFRAAAPWPHNPFINSGAIMTASLVEPEKDTKTRFEAIVAHYQSMGAAKIGFNESMYASEKETGHRNEALVALMRERQAFECAQTDDHLDLYYRLCSTTADAEDVSKMASTLANGGVNPSTGERVIGEQTVRECLSLMLSCGMYDSSGQFACAHGFPAKSGVSGCLMIVLPGVGGICTFSPRLDRNGNSVRGNKFCHRFSELTECKHHIFAASKIS